ncbi:hypothetical protein BKA63DRAFT_409058 [Paraphoma chrysanthemicola]|nr:hypothetical protein BKA63DRAFT_409058 [Paraphoma chrysanthemicola]
MVTNAPYYQMRSGQFITVPNSTNAPAAQFAAEDNEYDLSAAAVASPNEHHPSFHSEHPMRQTSADTTLVTMEENHNLADLLEAATTATGEAAKTVDDHEAVASRPAVQGRSKRKRTSSPPAEDAVVTPRSRPAIAPKRRRVNVPTDPQLQDVDHAAQNDIEENNVPLPSDSPLSGARAAGIHSAAALFRRTSERTSRKYTRPPMSKLFMSLQLSPENFLQLQAHAKTYMLDTAYPERQNCVGNRGKGDTDMVKLRLFNCVRDFLNDGVGEQFFGENVEKQGERDAIEAARALGEDQVPNMEEKLTWPRDGNKIISLVTPLMRRMVTNERQRMYAIETRKGSTKKKDKDGSVEATTQQAAQKPHISNINIFLVLAPRSLDEGSPKSGAKLDEKRIGKKEPSQNLVTYPWSGLVAEIATLLDRATARYPALLQHTAPQDKHSSTLRNVPDSSDHVTDNLQELAAAANAMQGEHAAHVGRDSPVLDSARLPACLIKTVGPTGWEIIDSAEEWNALLQRRGSDVWADGVVNLVVELVDEAVASDIGGGGKLSS